MKKLVASTASETVSEQIDVRSKRVGPFWGDSLTVMESAHIL